MIVASSVLLAARPVRAESNGDALEITVTTSRGPREPCLTQQALRARVAHYASAADSARGLRVHVRSAEGAAEFEVSRDARVLARRRFESLPSVCDDRRDTLAVAIALAVENAAREQREDTVASSAVASGASSGPSDSSATSSATAALSSADQSQAESATVRAPAADSPKKPAVAAAVQSAARESARTQPKPELESEATPERDDASERRDLPVAWLRAGARYAWQVLPKPVLVFAAGAELPLSEHLSLSFAGLASMPARGDFATRQLRSQLFGAEALGCGRTAFGLLGMSACAGFAGGLVSAIGQTYDENRRVLLAWVASSLRLALAVPVAAPVALRLFVDGSVNVVRPRPQTLGMTTEVPTKLGATSLGIELIVTWP